MDSWKEYIKAYRTLANTHIVQPFREGRTSERLKRDKGQSQSEYGLVPAHFAITN